MVLIELVVLFVRLCKYAPHTTVSRHAVCLESRVQEGWIKWNFTKFLTGRDGKPPKRFAPITCSEKGFIGDEYDEDNRKWQKILDKSAK